MIQGITPSNLCCSAAYRNPPPLQLMLQCMKRALRATVPSGNAGGVPSCGRGKVSLFSVR